MHSTASATSSRTPSTAATDTLRPRARRLISGLDDDEDAGATSSGLFGGPSIRVASPRGSRTVSPVPGELPSKHPSRTSVRDPPRSSFARGGGAGTAGVGKRGASPSASGASFGAIWGGSWSGVKGFANSLLGGDVPTGGASTGRATSAPGHSAGSAKRSTSEWGPSGTGAANTSVQIGGGSREERDALVRAAKRKDMLRANGHTMVDASGRHKRRTSDDLTGLSGSVQPSEEDDRDALVYLHHVKPQDTFIGLTIRYNCQPGIIRKANRLWPNDPIQSRKHILLPVDACGVKGRPVAGPEEHKEQDLLGDATNETLSMHESPKSPTRDAVNGRHKTEDIPVGAGDILPPSSLPTSSANVSTIGDLSEIQWKHESWVLFPGDKDPAEIVRLPRRHLGFFPRARRKSNPYSDLGTPRITPTASLDLPRIPSSPGSAQSEAFASLTRPSIGSRNRSASQSAFTAPLTTAQMLFAGPGGIGTLGKNVRTIGPARDRLNELLGPHLPDVKPPRNQTVFTPWNPGVGIRDEDLISFAESAASTPVGSAYGPGGAPGGGTVDLQEMSGAVERWVRKTVKRAGSAYGASAATAAQRGAGVQGMGVGSGVGDLIELTDAFEIGDGDAQDDLLDIGGGNEGSSAARLGGAGGEGMRGRRMGRDGEAGKGSFGKDH